MDYWVWIIPVIYFVVSAIGGVASKKAKEVAQRGRERRVRTTIEPLDEPLDEPVPPASTVSLPSSAPQPRASGQKTADEIASEIRRMMGLPVPDTPIVRPAEVAPEYEEYGDYDESYEVPAPEEQHQRSHGGDLRSRMAARDVERERSSGAVTGRRLDRKRSALIDRYVNTSVGRPARPAVASARLGGGRTCFDLSDMAQAFVTAEVFGPPRALRELEF